MTQPSHSAERARTIGDLPSREVDVRPDPPGDVLTREAIEQYRRFLALEGQNEQLRAEAMRRLGDLQLELQIEVGDLPQEGSLDDFSGLPMDEAVALYEGLLATHPGHDRNDTVLYQLARAHEIQGRIEEALSVLNQLVVQHPRSSWYVEAQFRRGEMHFGFSRHREAEAAYEAVIAAGTTTGFFDQALYKLGWSLFRQRRDEPAVSTFLRLLDRLLVDVDGWRLRSDEQLGRAQMELADDAMRAVATTYLERAGVESLDAALQVRGDPLYAHLLYGALGELYLEKERFQDAALAFDAFPKRRAEAVPSPALQERSIDAYQRGGFTSRVIVAKQSFVERYALGAAYWQQRRVEDSPQVADQLRRHLLDLAQYHHARAQAGGQAEDFVLAARWYQQLLDFFPLDQRAPQTNYQLAEVLFEAGQPAAATREYERTAYDYPAHERSASAGYAALVAYQQHETTLPESQRAIWHRQGVDSALRFAVVFPNHAQSAQVQVRATESLFALGDFERVIQVSRQILARAPKVEREYQRIASALLAHALFDRQQFAAAEAAYVEVGRLLLADDPTRAEIEQRLAAAIYRQGERNRDSGNASQAVSDFLRIATLAPGAAILATAQFDAAAILLQARQWERAAQVLEDLQRVHPDHELAGEVTRSLAVAYLEAGRESAAAAQFEQVATLQQQPMEVRRAALWQAAQLHESAGDTAQATRVLADYVQQFPQPLDAAMEARQKLVGIAEQHNDSAQLARWREAIIAADRDAGVQRTQRSRFLAAKAVIAQAVPEAAQFSSIRLRIPLQQSLNAKQAAMKRALARYASALDYQVAEVTTEATHGMAELYRGLAVDLMGSQRPAELDELAQEEYEVLLEEQAFPFEEQAIELYQANAARSVQGVWDDSVARSFQALAKLMPARYAKAEISEDFVPTLR